MTDREYAADCTEFLRQVAANIRNMVHCTDEDADKLEEIASVLQIDTQEETKNG